MRNANTTQDKVNAMKHSVSFCRLIALLLALVSVLVLFSACGTGDETTTAPDNGGSKPLPHVDYVGNLKLDLSSTATKKQEVTVKTFIDGDTTHFQSPAFTAPQFTQNTLKARYIAINTPESTGKVEEWGKRASNFTKEKLKNAVSIVLESDTADWEADSTGERYLVWVWYKPDAESDYRNLNLEILQNGLAIASKSSGNRYGTICLDAITQARSEKLYLYSEQPDPDFYYGEAIHITLRELRCNIAEYEGVKVAFDGVVTVNSDGGVYVEEYDAESDAYYGIYVYYGYNLTGKGYKYLTTLGNRIKAVGTVNNFNGTYQISDIQYDGMNPTDPNNVQLISQNNPPAYVETTIEQLLSKVKVPVGEEGTLTEFDYSYLILGSSLELKNITVTSVYTTNNGGNNDGAMTLTCKDASGKYFDVRTELLYVENESGEEVLATAALFQGKTIDVRGIMDYFDYEGEGNGSYQIKITLLSDVTFHN